VSLPIPLAKCGGDTVPISVGKGCPKGGCRPECGPWRL